MYILRILTISVIILLSACSNNGKAPYSFYLKVNNFLMSHEMNSLNHLHNKFGVTEIYFKDYTNDSSELSPQEVQCYVTSNISDKKIKSYDPKNADNLITQGNNFPCNMNIVISYNVKKATWEMVINDYNPNQFDQEWLYRNITDFLNIGLNNLIGKYKKEFKK